MLFYITATFLCGVLIRARLVWWSFDLNGTWSNVYGGKKKVLRTFFAFLILFQKLVKS